MDWEAYENITRYIYETLGKQAGVTIVGHGRDCKVTGKSTVSHQVDVLTSHGDGIHTYKTAIECKYWKDSINKDIIMKVAEIIEDAALHKGVIVSKNGFTDDAVKFAQYKNIGLVQLREATEDDVKDEPRIIAHKSWVLRPTILNTIIIPSLFNRMDKEQEELAFDDIKLIKNDGTEVTMKSIYDDFMNELKKQPEEKIIEKKIFMPMTKFINTKRGKTIYIDGFELRGKLSRIDMDLKWYPYDEVWMVMKTIFENKTFTISKRGVIKEKTDNAK